MNSVLGQGGAKREQCVRAGSSCFHYNCYGRCAAPDLFKIPGGSEMAIPSSAVPISWSRHKWKKRQEPVSEWGRQPRRVVGGRGGRERENCGLEYIGMIP